MNVEVATANGVEVDVPGATSYNVDDGYLMIYGPDKKTRAVFAPGQWAYALVLLDQE